MRTNKRLPVLLAFIFLNLMNVRAQNHTNFILSRHGATNATVPIDFSTGVTPYGKFNTFYGYRSGEKEIQATIDGDSETLGWQNTFIGTESGKLNYTAKDNTFIGFQAGLTNVVGEGNVYVGSRAGSGALGSKNTSIGMSAGHQMQGVGNSNVFVGGSSGFRSTGSYNVCLGDESGMGNASTSIGSNNVFIGYQAGKHANGNYLISNTLHIHSGGITYAPLIGGNFLTRNLSFNVSADASSRLTINATTGRSGLRFTHLTSASATTPSNGRVLTVNTDGDVVLTTDLGGTGTTDTSIYSHDGTIGNTNMTLPGVRTVDLGNHNLWFKTADETGRMYIGGAGNFPTNTSGDYRLYVEGGVLTEKVKVALEGTANWADYVFADDYNLMPLDEVESFIKTNKHLPGIESAEELQKSGLDLADMQRKQMEKIEELTLHLIEQDKVIEQQRREIEVLKAQVILLLNK